MVEWTATHERLAVIGSVALAAALGLYVTTGMGNQLMMLMMQPPGATYALLLFVMWWSMMMAMMLPSAAPAILTYGGLRRNFVAKGTPQPPLIYFVAGYAAVWTAFSLAAVGLQLLARNVLALSHMFALTSALLGGVLLIGAGIYQLTPLKHACLRRCQAPAFYIARHWRNTPGGTFAMGFSHGLYCLGCCWVLMLLLFYGGVMELTWIVGLAAYVAAEKLLPVRSLLAQLSGVALIIWGCAVLYGAFA
jgi:predicted metal-binding membrane protein